MSDPVEETHTQETPEQDASTPPQKFSVQVVGFYQVSVSAKSQDYAEGIAAGMIKTEHPDFNIVRTASNIAK